MPVDAADVRQILVGVSVVDRAEFTLFAAAYKDLVCASRGNRSTGKSSGPRFGPVIWTLSLQFRMSKAASPHRVNPDSRVAPGAPAALAIPVLVDLHGPKLYSLASRLCGNTSDAEDMVQDVFLQAQRKWHTFKGNADPGTWLYAIAAHACKARTRRKGGIDRRMPAVSQIMPWTDDSIADLTSAPGSTVGRAIERESAEAVHRAIVDLPQNFRVPLILKEMLELSLEDVGNALDLKPETVKTRVHRARLMLRKAILARKEIPKKPAPAPTYDMQVCVDLLHAKLDAMDHGRSFPIGQRVVCERCRAVFAELDLAKSACAKLASGEFPRELRDRIVRSAGRAR